MGLVEYSDSESEGETLQQKPAPAAAPPQKTFQKLLDRSSGAGKIVVNLPSASAASEPQADDEQPPAKRAKTAGGSRFSSLGSFLPPPKKTKPAAPAASTGKSGTAPAPGVHLRTAAEPAFVRGGGNDDTADADGDAPASSGLNLPPPSKGPAGPSILEGQKSEEEVKLVGKPLMFKPLSVARRKAPAKNKKTAAASVAASSPGGAQPPNGPTTTAPAAAPSTEPPPAKKKISLFSMGDDEPTSTAAAPTGAYEPLFTSAPDPTPLDQEESDVTSAYPTYHPSTSYPDQQQQQPNLPDDLHTLAAGLSPAARRELFGRPTTTNPSSSSTIPSNAKIISFNMEREYAHNEALRSSGAGAQLAYNPVRSIAPGKHSLRQVVEMARSNQDALEESFARNKGSQREAKGRYGW